MLQAKPTKVSASTNTSPIGSSHNLSSSSLGSNLVNPPSLNSNTPVNHPVPKPVECNLCHRKFKNVPALNGHMRLHGGYFKKDSDSKKNEKKELAGPPLQTASVSVRALIEEKIINKRSTNSHNMTHTNTTTTASSTLSTPSRPPLASTAPPLYPLTNNNSHNSDLKLSSFVIPASPSNTVNTVQTKHADKHRRMSDTDRFTMPKTPSSNTTQQEADALAELILKRAKIVKRAVSDPGYVVQKSAPVVAAPIPSPQRKLQLQLEQAGEAFSLANITFQNDEDTEIFTQSLQDEVFNQVQQTMLLQGKFHIVLSKKFW